MLNYDLHCHSTASDGVISPAAVIERAAAQGVDVLALTDHDVTAGLAEARQAALRNDITLINGVEISVTWQNQLLHIVGLGFDEANPQLQQGLQRLRNIRESRADEIALKLQGLGIQGANDGARRLAAGSIVSRSHFARFLVEQGKVSGFQQAFDRYLKKGKPAYVACQWASLEEVVSWINEAGGQAVIAHPARYRLSLTKLRALLVDFIAVGGRGIEVACSSHNPAEKAKMADLACHYELLASAGSDFHEPDRGWAELGRCTALPGHVTPIWHDWPCQQRSTNNKGKNTLTFA